VSLARGHADLSCLDCHTQPNATAAARACVSCHGTKHGGLKDCQRCHDPSRGWTPDFVHDTVFKLSGVHATLACTKCHTAGRYFGTNPKCSSCHGRKHGGLTACASCHTTSAFKPTTFRHSRVFPLSPGPHAKFACTRCHPNRQFAKVRGRTCAGCHGPQHGGLRKCTPCHTRTGALSGKTDHSVFFPLLGAHKALACSTCHGSPFRPAPGKQCVDCHGGKHGNQTSCGNCHTTTSFSPIKAITHPNGIRISGHHGSLSGCAECHHTPLDFGSTPNACTKSGCHVVPHVGPSDCLRCHSPSTSWLDLHFTHPQIPPHGPLQFKCVFCHEYNDFTMPRSVICVICHDAF
jgi:hypothetical protein